jgi:DNA-binding NarL/FixJ family response regulator
MDGIATLREIRSSFPYARMIILTATQPDQTRDRAFSAGASSYIPKSPLAEHLLAEIHRVATL